MADATEIRMFVFWFGFVIVDGVVSATISSSNTAGYLSLAGVAIVLVVTWYRYPGSGKKRSVLRRFEE